MFIFSETSVAFTKRCLQTLKEIVREEVGLKMNRSRFQFAGYMYPLRVHVFEDSKVLGRFFPSTYEIQLNKCLMYKASDEVIKDTLRHELAHYLTHLHYGGQIQHHGPEFREICHRFGWGESVYKSSIRDEQLASMQEASEKNDKVLQKVTRLLQLSQSQNIHESQLAMAKANELLTKYNLSFVTEDEREREFCMERVYSQKKVTGKLNAIYEILLQFYVAPVINYGKGEVYIEVSGGRENVEVAGFVANFLSIELERLWDMARKENPKLKGVRHKNSFMRGLAQGQIEKINQSRSSSREYRKALIKIENDLTLAKKWVYGRIGEKASYQNIDQFSQAIGRKFGGQMSISKPLGNRNESRKRLSWNS